MEMASYTVILTVMVIIFLGYVLLYMWPFCLVTLTGIHLVWHNFDWSVLKERFLEAVEKVKVLKFISQKFMNSHGGVSSLFENEFLLSRDIKKRKAKENSPFIQSVITAVEASRKINKEIGSELRPDWLVGNSEEASVFNFFEKEKRDSQISREVISEIRWDESVNSSQLGVTVNEGIVTLRGNVSRYAEKSMAEDAAQRVGGVRAVVNEIEVKLMGFYERTDEDIARAALCALEWNYSVPKGIRVSVEKGWITLRGEVDWDYQRNAAKYSVSHLMGVFGVNDYMTIKTKVRPSDVKSRIEEALMRSSENEGRDINVVVSGDRVTLNGKVHSPSEISKAGHAAWGAPGVMTVENNLKLAAN